MADEQYAWLDKEAAEKLLRGEPVDPAEGRPRQDAERLATALDAVARTARPATGELPGEAAALAAFRAAPRRPRAAGATAAHDDAETAVLAPVHIGRAAGPRGDRPFRWSRPLRFGLAASLACCAIGGVAVAAGSGMLPGPFGRHTPTPATSVSAAESPEELGTDVVPDEETSAPPPPGTPAPDAPTPGGRTGTDSDDEDTARPGDGASHDDRKGEDDAAGGDRTGGTRTGGGADPGDDASDDGGNEDPGKGNDHGGDDASGSWYAKTLQACRDYRDGTLDADRRTRLEALAKGARNLDRFCDRLLAAEENGHGGAGDGEQGGDASAPLPAIRFTESPGPSTAAVAPDPGTDTGTETGTTAGSDAFTTPVPAASAAAR
ncbi:hypothetical protein ACFUJY_06690 [Streptomyces sp. NPDC057249]|uniref:hypothetical protein n=1 Tax=Streptomyces sp. NPDC057249 TaxID=3346067 RepID=UPI00362533F7